MQTVLVVFAFIVGGLLAVQAAANVQLSKAIGSPVGAAALQLGIATLLLTVLVVLSGTLAALARLSDVTPWHLLGGLASAAYIFAGIVLFPRLGALVAVALFVTGQLVASLVLDAFGLLGLARAPISALSLTGVLAIAAGMTAILRSADRPVRASGLATARVRLMLLGLGLLAGAGLPVQAAVNARLRADLDAPVTAAAISFVVATTGMLVVLVGTRANMPIRPRPEALRRMPPWGWIGGLIGASYVMVSLLAVSKIGAASTIALTIAGQQLASAVIDDRGLFRLPRRPLTPNRLLGVTVLAAGAVLLQLG